MTALYIILPILLFIALLLFSRVRLSLTYDGALRLRASYLFLRFALYPRKKRISKRPPARSTRKKKKAKYPQSSTDPASAKPKPKRKSKKKQPMKLADIRFLLHLFRDVLGHILDKSSRHVRIRIKRLYLSIGGANDAAKAAIEYGLVSQSVAYLFEFLENTSFLRRPKARAVHVGVNFLEEEHRFAIRTDITCPLLFLIPLALSSLTKALTAKTRWARHRAHSAKSIPDKNHQAKENDNG